MGVVVFDEAKDAPFEKWFAIFGELSAASPRFLYAETFFRQTLDC